jgi:hypothetical protein
MRLMIADDIVKARKRMRYTWIAVFVYAAISLFVALSSFSGVNYEAQSSWSTRQFAFVMGEVGLMMVLAFGVLKRIRAAAVLLFFYFLVSKVTVYSIGMGVWRALPLQLVLGYLFFQGMRGAFTFHHLTHRKY